MGNSAAVSTDKANRFTQTSMIYGRDYTELKNSSSTWCGRGISAVGNGICKFSGFMANTAQQTIRGLSLVCADPNAIASAFRKVDPHLLSFYERLSGAKDAVKNCAGSIKCHVAVIDFFQVVADIYYFACRKFREEKNEKGEVVKARDNGLVIGGRLSLAAANFGGAFLWLKELGCFSSGLQSMPRLQKAAACVGNLRVFSFLGRVSCLSLVLRGLDLGYSLLAIDAARRVGTAVNSAQKTSACLDLSSYVSELVLSAMVFAGVTSVVGLGVAATVCVVFATSSFLYRAMHDKEMKQKPEVRANGTV